MAASAKPLSWYYVQATQGSNDAFVQQSFSTALAGLTTQAALVREIWWELAGPVAVAGASYEMEIGYKTAAAVSTIYDKTVIWRRKRTVQLATSGVLWWDNVERVLFQDSEGFYLVSDPLYFRCDSNASGASNVFNLRIGYELVTVNANDRLTLLANALL